METKTSNCKKDFQGGKKKSNGRCQRPLKEHRGQKINRNWGEKKRKKRSNNGFGFSFVFLLPIWTAGRGRHGARKGQLDTFHGLSGLVSRPLGRQRLRLLMLLLLLLLLALHLLHVPLLGGRLKLT